MSAGPSGESRKTISQHKITGKIAENSVRDFFERHSQVYLVIDQSNDYGKDAYVDLVEGNELTGLVIAVQVKGGRSYRRDSKYYIPYSPSDRNLWVDSSVPVFGIVHDDELSCLHWVSLTSALLDRPSDKHGHVEVKLPLNEETWPDFYRHAARAAKLGGRSLLGLYSDDSGQQHAAISDSFAIGRFDARALVMLRRSLRYLPADSLEHAIWALAHVVLHHPDRWWSENNEVSGQARSQAIRGFNWDASDAGYLLKVVDQENMFRRGSIGEDIYLLLSLGWGPDVDRLFRDTLETAIDSGDMDIAFKALAIIQYRSECDAPEVLFEIVKQYPVLLQDVNIRDLLVRVQDHGWLDLA